MSDISVEVEQLRGLASNLRGMRSEFDSMKGTVADYHDEMGHPDVSAKLGDFATNWSQKRVEVGKLIDDLAGYAEGAADTYAEVEAAIASGMTKT